MCPAVVPTTCEGCIVLGKQCIRNFEKVCTKMGRDSKTNTCEQQVSCPAVVSSSCEMYQRAYPDCIGKHAKLCTLQFAWDEKGNSCPTQILYGIGYTPPFVRSDCEACKRLGPDCVDSHKKTCVKKFKWNQNDNSCPTVNPIELVAPCNSPTLISPD